MKYLTATILTVSSLAGCMPTVEHAQSPTLQAPPTLPAAPKGPTAVVISKTSISLSDSSRELVSLPVDASRGAPAEVKRQGANGLFIIPLGDALEVAKSHGTLGPSLNVAVDEATPYRLLFEVLYTAGQSKLGTFDLHENRIDGRGFSVTLPSIPTDRHRTDSADPNQPPLASHLNLTVLVVESGIGLKASGGNVAPGCNDAGPGLAISGPAGHRDLAALTACAAKLKHADSAWANEDTVVLVGSPAAPFHDIADVVEALRGAHGELFPKVQLGVAR